MASIQSTQLVREQAVNLGYVGSNPTTGANSQLDCFAATSETGLRAGSQLGQKLLYTEA